MTRQEAKGSLRTSPVAANSANFANPASPVNPVRSGAIALLLAALLATAFAVAPGGARTARADLAGFTITDFHTELFVEEDAGLLVEETIQVNFNEPRRGIYRTIPVRYTDPRGYRYGVQFRLLDVVDEDGRSHTTDVSREGSDVRIRIGDADRTITGPVTYVIRYHVDGAIQHLETHDELYWNAVGDSWATTIEQASATVHLPGSLSENDVEAAAFAGVFGSTEGDVSIQVPEPSTVIYASPRALAPFEAMTVVAGWPHGNVTFPSPAMIWLRRLLSNWVLVLPFVALAWMTSRYRSHGRDPEGAGSITVQYEAPEGIGPGEIGTLVDESVDMRDITATLVDLAVKGLLRIEIEEKKGLFRTSEETAFVRIAPPDDPQLAALLPHELAVFNGIFAHGQRVDTSDLNHAFYRELPGIKSAMFTHLVSAGFFAESPESVKLKYGGLVALLALGVFALGAVTAFLTGGIFPNALVVPGVAAALTGLFAAPFVPAMPRRTAEGVRMREWAKGFEEFVGRVESDRLERVEAVTAFETLLPYAMALGVAETWAKKFEGIYAEGRQPGWYVGPHHGGMFSTRSFERSLSSSMGAVATSMAAAPRSSSSSGMGGGGFSGGGFGGGGGGSW